MYLPRWGTGTKGVSENLVVVKNAVLYSCGVQFIIKAVKSLTHLFVVRYNIKHKEQCLIRIALTEKQVVKSRRS